MRDDTTTIVNEYVRTLSGTQASVVLGIGIVVAVVVLVCAGDAFQNTQTLAARTRSRTRT